MPDSPDDLNGWTWTIGQIVAPFGIRGEVKVRLETDFPNRFADLKEACVRGGSTACRKSIEGCRLHKGQALVKFAGVESIEHAERLRGSLVQIPRSAAVELPRDSYYRDDLVGLEVVTVAGACIGTVDEVLRYPAQDLLRVGEALIPAVRPIVRSIDLKARRVVVDPPEGLLPGGLEDAN